VEHRSWLDQALEAARTVRGLGKPINPEIAALMAAHESGFGRSTPPGSNNVLGIKAGRSWNGPTVNARTLEFTGAGERYDTSAAWRVYPGLKECFTDYGNIIERLWWFADAAAAKDDPVAFLKALQPIYGPDGQTVKEPGYFTDPNYAQAILALGKQYGLLPTAATIDPIPSYRLMARDNRRLGTLVGRVVGDKFYVVQLQLDG
jgi:flagellum-specific peptidoglycan hydrolase FlgJ